MPSVLQVFFCSIIALLFWGTIGIALSRRLAPPVLAIPIAPALGWAVHSALALPLYRFIGFTPVSVLLGSLVYLLAASLALRVPISLNWEKSDARVPSWAYLLAVMLATVPAMALFPKFSGDAVAFAGPISDHSKIAIINEMTRLGVPPSNPFFGEAGHDAPLAYYYLWHFSAAELALIPGVNGWAADIALTAFTAFSSVALMMGFAVWISGRGTAGVWVVPLAFAASLHITLETLFGVRNLYSIFLPPTGFGGWLFQTSWAPQHTASTSCVLLSSFLLLQLARRPTPLTLISLSLATVAGFESSTWVGGIVFAVASPAMAIILLMNASSDVRRRFVVSCVVAAFLATILAYPFLYDQFHNAVARGVGSPIAFKPYVILSLPHSDALRRALDIPAFWLVLLVVEFPAIYASGVISLITMLRLELTAKPTLLMAKLLFALALVGLLIAGYFTITFADNNDLGWRAVLPPVFILTIFAAIGVARWLATPTPVAASVALLLLLLALPRSLQLTEHSARGVLSASGGAFTTTPAMWGAVRRHTGAADRVANNPLFMADLTPWPVNISWALFANRASCFAGKGLVLPYSSLPHDQIDQIEKQFERVFEGHGSGDDLRDIATRFQCRTVVLTPHDGAWHEDPFANSSQYALAEEEPGAWRIYRLKRY